ncbi:MAG: glycoside hydrolase family 9 protein, partial [Bacteroidota bacterium]
MDHRPGVNGFSVRYSEYSYLDGDNAFDQLPAQATTFEMPGAWGGWMDAVDFDRRNEHMIVSAYLNLIYELAPEKFTDGQLNLPESGNGLPDVLDEAYWGIDLFRRLKGPTEGICGGLEANDHPLQGEASWTDSTPWFAYAEDPVSSYRLAGVLAQMAWVLELAGVSDSTSTFIQEARAAYNWAEDNPAPAHTVQSQELRAYAAACLFKLGGEDRFHQDFLSYYNAFDYAALGNKLPENDTWHQLAVWMYITTNRPDVDTDVQTALRNLHTNLADFLLLPVEERACRVAGNYWSPPVVGRTLSTPETLPLLVQYELAGASNYLKYLYSSADYALGNNALNMTWVTGLGDRSPRNPAQIDGSYDDVDGPIPGIVP